MSIFRDHLKVDDLDGPRWELAVEQLMTGHPVVFDSVAVDLRGGRFSAQIVSEWSNPDHVPAASIQRDLRHAERAVSAMTAASPALAAYAASVPFERTVVVDYGMGAIAVGTNAGDGDRWPDGELITDARGNTSPPPASS